MGFIRIKMKTAIIFGSSGLIGTHLFNIILQNNNYDKIKLFGRSNLLINNLKAESYKLDFNDLDNYKNLIKGNDCFFCIGTTKKDSPDKVEYRRIEYNIPTEIAKIAKSNSIESFFYVSSGGANYNSSNSYLKNKGQVEKELIKLNFKKLSIIRPSLLLGKRKNFRLGERIAQIIISKLPFLFLGNLKKYKPIKAEDVAKAMVYIAQNNFKEIFFESNKLEEINKEYKL